MQGLAAVAGLLPQEIAALFLAYARISTIVMLLPGIGEAMVPSRVRLAIALAVTAAIAPQVMGLYPALPVDPIPLSVLLFGEILIGLMIGLIARMIMSALSVAGSAIAMQTGLGFVQAIDPAFGVQGAIIGTFLSITAMTFIFATGAHELLFASIAHSFVLFAPGAAPPIADFADLAVTTLGGAFALGIQIATPFLIFGLVFNLAAGVLSKVMPQVQIFFIAMPANILLGLMIFMLTIGAAVMWFADHFATTLKPLSGI